MTDTPSNYDRDLERKIDQVIMSGLGGGAPDAGTLADPKQVFCQNWRMVKTALQALAVLVPKASWIVQLIIAAGDKTHQELCGG